MKATPLKLNPLFRDPDLFRGKRRADKIHQKSPSVVNAKFPGKFEEKIQKNFLESRSGNYAEKDYRATARG